MTSSKYVRYTFEDTSALYIDGELDVIGETYHSDERIAQLLGVEDHGDNDAFLLGGGGRGPVAQTLDEIDAYNDQRNAKLAEAQALRARAAELEAEADALSR